MEISLDLLTKMARYIELREQHVQQIEKQVKKASYRDPAVDISVVDTAEALIKAGSYTEAQRGALIEKLLDHKGALALLKKTAGRPANAGELGQPAEATSAGKMSEADAAYLRKIHLLVD